MIIENGVMILENNAAYGGSQGGNDMGTVTRPELSNKNRWWISKHRYYELRHFCLQYDEWKAGIKELDGYSPMSSEMMERINVGQTGDPTERIAQIRSQLSDKTRTVRSAAYEACDHQFWYTFLIQAVTESASYDVLEARFGIMPVSRNEWYDVYRKFFWILDKMRD